MKNQYFGDVRDLFKYDLIQQILEGMSRSEKEFTFIPMLTKYDPKSGDGNKRNFAGAKKRGKPGTNNEKLVGFLERNKRDFTRIENYFKKENIKMVRYRGQHKYFGHETRHEYFENIHKNKNLLHKPLVFVDPDIGLEVEKLGEKHLLYCEVKRLYKDMSEDSILMIYQHFPRDRKNNEKYLPNRRSDKLKVETGDLPLCISNNEIAFLLLTKNRELKNQLESTIRSYKECYPKSVRVCGLTRSVKCCHSV